MTHKEYQSTITITKEEKDTLDKAMKIIQDICWEAGINCDDRCPFCKFCADVPLGKMNLHPLEVASRMKFIITKEEE